MRAYNHKYGQTIETDVPGLDTDRAFPSHVEWYKPEGTAADSVITITLGAQEKTVENGFEEIDYARGLIVVGSASGMTGNVVVTGVNLLDEEISETFALSGTSTKTGEKAFKAITEIVVPVEYNTPRQQVETATAAGTVSQTGHAKCVITSALVTGSPLTIPFPVVEADGGEEIAAALRAVLQETAAITGHYEVSGTAESVVLTALVAADDDTSLNIAIDNGDGDGASVGITPALTSANTTGGVAPDAVLVGVSNVLGLPYKLGHDTTLLGYLGASRDAGLTVTVDSEHIEKNTVKLTSALTGSSSAGVYLLV